MRGEAGPLEVMMEHGPVEVCAAGLHQVLRGVAQARRQSIGHESLNLKEGRHIDVETARRRERVIDCEEPAGSDARQDPLLDFRKRRRADGHRTSVSFLPHLSRTAMLLSFL